jgi:hypothetical protein
MLGPLSRVNGGPRAPDFLGLGARWGPLAFLIGGPMGPLTIPIGGAFQPLGARLLESGPPRETLCLDLLIRLPNPKSYICHTSRAPSVSRVCCHVIVNRVED